jgi:hypothetical protein
MHVHVSCVVAVDMESTHHPVHGRTSWSSKAHRNDQGFARTEDRVDSDVNALGDIIDSHHAICLEDFDAVDEGVLCNAKFVTTDYGSDMCAIWKGEKEKLVSCVICSFWD